MNDIITQNLLTFILGGGLLSFITGVITLKYTKKQAEAKALSSMQDVYQELITDLRTYNTGLKKDKEESENRLSARIIKLEERQAAQEQKIAGNEREIEDLKRFKCTNLTCNHRKQ
nr:MAG TPA: hypothetical protein [Caudoviricetes sp.]